MLIIVRVVLSSSSPDDFELIAIVEENFDKRRENIRLEKNQENHPRRHSERSHLARWPSPTMLLLLSSNAFQKMSQKLLAVHKIKLNYKLNYD